MSNPVKHIPETLVFRPTYTGQVLVQSVIIPNVPSDIDLTAILETGSSVVPFKVLSVASYEVVRIVPGGQIVDMTLDSESDGMIPLSVRKGELVEIFIQLMVPNQISGAPVDRLSVAGLGGSSPHENFAFFVPVIALFTNVTIEFPPFEIHPGETKAVPVEAFPGLSPVPSITLHYAPQGDTQFSAPPVTFVFRNGQPATGLVSVTCAGGASSGFYYLRFDVNDPANDPFDSLSVVVEVVPLSPLRSRWEFVGPKNYGIIHTGASPVSGRVNAVAFDRRRPGTWYLGAAMGGVWKTTNFGDTWTPLSDQWKFLPVSSIAIDPTEPNTVYAGTGDVPQPSYAMGVMKSSDGGFSWSAAGADQFGSATISKVLVDPRSSNIVWVTTFPGQVWRSPDAGITWKAADELPSTWWLGIERAVSSARATDRYYAVGEGVGAELWRTDNGGAHWTKLKTPLSQAFQQRPLVACSPIFPDNVYLFAPTDQRIYGSKDAGITWSDITDNWNDWGADLRTYNFCLACSYAGDPNTNGARDVIYLGQAVVYRSAPGGGQWQEVEGNTLGHADQHAIAVNPLDPNSILVGNDGGIFNATFIPDLGSTTVFSINQSLGITQVYRADYSPDAQFIIAGTQDVGTAATFGDIANWSMVGGGDGGSCAINPRSPDIQYLQSNFSNSQMQLLRTGNRWQSSTDFAHPLMRGEPRSSFAPMVLDPNNPRVLYVATNFLYRWVEPGEAEGGWVEHLGNRSLALTGYINALAIAPSDSSRIYTGSNETNEVWMSTDASNTWRRIDDGLPRTGGITSISVHPNNPSDVLVAIWKPTASNSRLWHCRNTMDGFVVWNDVTSRGRPNALPDFPTNAIARDLTNSDRNWYVGTDIGVFFTDDSGLNWYNATEPLGLPNVAISELKLVPQARHIYAATFGRGIWRVTV